MVGYDLVATFSDLEYADSADHALAVTLRTMVVTDWDEFDRMTYQVVIDGQRIVDPRYGVITKAPPGNSRLPFFS